MASADQPPEREPRSSRNLERQERQDNLAELRASIAGEFQTAEDLLLHVRQLRKSDVLAAGLRGVDEEATQELGEHLDNLDIEEGLEIEAAVVRGKGRNAVVSYVAVDENGNQVKGICDLPDALAKGSQDREQRTISRQMTGKSDAKDKSDSKS